MRLAARSRVAAARSRLGTLSWVQRSVLVGAVCWFAWLAVDWHSLEGRLLRDGILFFAIPMALALAHERDLGWRVDRRAVRNAVLLSAFVVPFYVVGSTLPSVRAFYPMWGLESAALSVFVPHAIKQFALVLAVETFYRGLFCVGIREKGPWVAFVSPVLYALHHVGKPPIELLLSGPTDALFGLADYYSASLLPSVCAHGLGLVLLDWLVLHEPVVAPETTTAWLELLPLPV